jgi:hypothetical protein
MLLSEQDALGQHVVASPVALLVLHVDWRDITKGDENKTPSMRKTLAPWDV